MKRELAELDAQGARCGVRVRGHRERDRKTSPTHTSFI